MTVTRQKKLALQDCEKLGLHVEPQHVYIDNGTSAWQRNRQRPGWDALLEAARRGEIKHIVCYRKPYLAGISVHKGRTVGTGVWPTIIDRATWDLAQEMKQFRSATFAPPEGDARPRRFCLLRGVVVCSRCGTAMSGGKGMYKCTRDIPAAPRSQ